MPLTCGDSFPGEANRRIPPDYPTKQYRFELPAARFVAVVSFLDLGCSALYTRGVIASRSQVKPSYSETQRNEHPLAVKPAASTGTVTVNRGATVMRLLSMIFPAASDISQ